MNMLNGRTILGLRVIMAGSAIAVRSAPTVASLGDLTKKPPAPVPSGKTSQGEEDGSQTGNQWAIRRGDGTDTARLRQHRRSP